MFFKSKGILGINARNLLYIKPYNPKKAIKLADDKIKTKQFLAARGIPVPKLYGIIKDTKDLEKFDFDTLPNTFVIKPNHGYGGEGIIPVLNKKKNLLYTAGGNILSVEEAKDHIRDILDGRFSISNIGDQAFFEQYIVTDEKVGKYSYEGLPDIRVVVHNLIPVMAMLRLPTKESKGKANLHQGAVGVGIDIAKGETTYISYKNKIIDELPDNLGKIKGIKIPYWDEILLIASKAQLITNLGYMAIDISLDKNSGPVILEINARAGLGVQIANLAPLRRRLERIEGLKITNPQKGVRIAKEMFGNTVEKEIAHISGKEIIGTEEEVEIIQKDGVFRLLAKIDTGRQISVLDEDLAIKNNLLDDTKSYEDEKSTLKLKFVLKNKRIQTIVDVEKILNKKYKMIIGQRDLTEFLVDINKTKREEKKFGAKKVQEIKPEVFAIKKDRKKIYQELDQKIIQIDNKIKLLYHLRPLNLETEKEKILKNHSYNPEFDYPKLKFDPLELIDELNKIEIDDSVLGKIFKDKKEEISDKIKLLEAMDEEEFTDISIKLFGKSDEKEIEECKAYIKELNFKKINKEEENLTAEDAKGKFEKVFEEYGLKHWKVKLKENLVADCVAGKNNSLFIKQDAKFSEERIEALKIHEIETHILTAENGKNQPYEIFNRGLPNYLTTQEGLATYNVEKVTHVPFSKKYKMFINILAIEFSIHSSFSETFRRLLSYGISQEMAFRSTLKAKRGFYDTSKKGAFTKDGIYLKGYKQVKQFVEAGGDLKDLYIGKINLENLSTIKQIPDLSKPKYLPKWLK